MPKQKFSKRKQPNRTHGNSHGPGRVPEEKGELFAVSRLMGGPHVRATCSDGTERLCMIRHKFRGRHKRGNEVGPGSLVLVGLYDWATLGAANGPQCDLLHVYSREQTRAFEKKSLLSTHIVGLLAAAGNTQAVQDLDYELVFSGELPQNSDEEEESSDSDNDEGAEPSNGNDNDDEPVGTLLAGPEIDLSEI
jgi:initiation factor 1A